MKKVTTIASNKKNARLDLRMTAEQKEAKLAASLSGISLSQWSLENLLTSAWEVIARSGHTVMAPADYDTFVEALDAPMNPTLKKFVSQKTM